MNLDRLFRTLSLCGVLLGLASWQGCRRHENRSTKGSPSPDEKTQRATSAQQATNQPTVGEQVVVEGGIATFWQAKVASIKGNRVRFTYGPNQATNQAPLARVYRIAEKSSRAPFRPGAPAICRTAPMMWSACRVRAARPGKLIVTDPSGQEHEVSTKDVLHPRGLTRTNIRKVLTSNQRRNSFLAQARAAGHPSHPANWEPTPGDEVVAMQGKSVWRSAKIRRVTRSSIQVIWSVGTRPSELSYSQVVPMPKHSQHVTGGQFVLVRPRRGTRWSFAKVIAAEGGRVSLENDEGTHRKVADTDVLPLGAP